MTFSLQLFIAIICMIFYVYGVQKEPKLLYKSKFECMRKEYLPEVYNFNTSVTPGDAVYADIVVNVFNKTSCFEYRIIEDYIRAIESVSMRYVSNDTVPVNFECLQKAVKAAYGNARSYPNDLFDYAEQIEYNYYVYCRDQKVAPLTEDVLITVYIPLYKVAIMGENYRPIPPDRTYKENMVKRKFIM